MATSVSAAVLLGNARFPVTISYSTKPNENWSDRKSSGRPLACSGDMYCTVPRTAPGPDTDAVEVSDSCPLVDASFARPKSRILTNPSSETIRFSGFKSLCAMPASCALASPSATCAAISIAFRIGSKPATSSSRSVFLLPAPSQCSEWNRLARFRRW